MTTDVSPVASPVTMLSHCDEFIKVTLFPLHKQRKTLILLLNSCVTTKGAIKLYYALETLKYRVLCGESRRQTTMTCENNIISRGYGSFLFILYSGTSRGSVIMSKYCKIKLERQFFRFICHMKFGKNF